MPLPRLGTRSVRPRTAPAAFLALAVALGGTELAVSLGGPGHGRAPDDKGRHIAVEVSKSRCGRGRSRPGPGVQTFDLHNSSDAAVEVYLEDPGNQAVYGEVEGIGPGTT